MRLEVPWRTGATDLLRTWLGILPCLLACSGCAGGAGASPGTPAAVEDVPSVEAVVARWTAAITWSGGAETGPWSAGQFRAVVGQRFRGLETRCVGAAGSSHGGWEKVLIVDGVAITTASFDVDAIGLRRVARKLGLLGRSEAEAVRAVRELGTLLLTPCVLEPEPGHLVTPDFPIYAHCKGPLEFEVQRARLWPGLGWAVHATVKCGGAPDPLDVGLRFRIAATFDRRGELDFISVGSEGSPAPP